jgi:hypothetical protein
MVVEDSVRVFTSTPSSMVSFFARADSTDPPGGAGGEGQGWHLGYAQSIRSLTSVCHAYKWELHVQTIVARKDLQCLLSLRQDDLSLLQDTVLWSTCQR